MKLKKNNFSLKKIAIFLILYYPFNDILAQDTLSFKGVVTGKNGEVLFGAQVVLYMGNAIKTFTTTNQKGYFELFWLQNNPKELQIKVSYLGYSSYETSDLSPFLKIQLQESAFILDSVLVFNQKDTVDLNIDSLLLNEQSTLSEILEKNHLTITKGGGISYKGEIINKILLDGKEVFINQNSIAMEMLRKEHMEGIRVINNYTDPFDIAFKKNKETILDINVKESFKGVLKNTLKAKYGYHNKYNSRLESYFFSEGFNAFLYTSTYNIDNQEGINYQELNPILLNFPVSDLLNRVAQALFVSTPYLLENFSHKTNFTLRKVSPNAKYNLSTYFIQQDNIEVASTEINSKNALLYNANTNTAKKTKGFLGDFSLNYRIDTNLVLKYNFGIFIVDNAFVETKNMFFSANKYSILREYQEKSQPLFFYNNIFLSKKIKDWLFSILTNYKYEKSYYRNATDKVFYNNLKGQNTEIKKDFLDIFLQSNYNISEGFIPSFGIGFYNGEEKYLNNLTLKKDDLYRIERFLKMDFRINGTYKNYQYSSFLGHYILSNSPYVSNNFFNGGIDIKYMFKKHNVLFSAIKTKSLNDLNYNRWNYKNYQIFLPIKSQWDYFDNFSSNIRYHYLDLFNGVSFEAYFSYKMFLNKWEAFWQKTIRDIAYFQIQESDIQDMTSLVSYKKKIPNKVVPFNIGGNITHQYSLSKTIGSVQNFQTQKITPSLILETIFYTMPNLKYEYIFEYTLQNPYTTKSHEQRLSFLMRTKNFRNTASFYHNFFNLNPKTNYQTKDIQITTEYIFKNWKFFLEARGILSLLKIVKNPYTSFFKYTLGNLSYSHINRENLQYIIFGVAYEF